MAADLEEGLVVKQGHRHHSRPSRLGTTADATPHGCSSYRRNRRRCSLRVLQQAVTATRFRCVRACFFLPTVGAAVPVSELLEACEEKSVRVTVSSPPSQLSSRLPTSRFASPRTAETHRRSAELAQS